MIPSFEEVMLLTRTVSGSPALTDEDALGFYRALSQIPQGGVVIEIGCEKGRSSSLILQMAKAIGFRSIHIDAYEHHADFLSQWAATMHSIDYPFTFFRARSIDSWTHGAVKAICANGASMVYVDGDHGYVGAKLDCEMYGPLVRKGGFLCAHDYDRASIAEVKPAVDSYVASGWEHVETTGYMGVWRRL
jgi:Methyltransferase domain